MLVERRARSCWHDGARHTLQIEVGTGGATPGDAEGTLLLDARGGVVGVDVEPTSPSRIVVMVGTHESVASTRHARLSVSRDVDGEVASVIVHGVDAPA